MADTAAAAPSLWSWLTTLSPSINYTLSALVGIALGATGLAGIQAVKGPTAPMVIAAADAPRPVPVPMVALSDLDHVLTPYGEKLDALRKMIDERISAPAKVAPSKAKVWK